jgi:hypothetical protein
MQRYGKKLGIPLHAFFGARHKAPESLYGGAIPLTGYTDLRGLTAQYDRKDEVLYVAFTVERTDEPLTLLGIPAEVADADLVPSKPAARGDIYTSRARTVAHGERKMVAVPDIAEGVDPQSAEWQPTATPSKGESLFVVVRDEEKEIPGFAYKEPLLTFYRDGKAFYAYVEERTAQPLEAVLGIIDENLTPVTPSQFAPGSTARDLGNGMVIISEPVPVPASANFKAKSASAPEVEHLGKNADGTFSQRFRVGLQGYFDAIAHDIGNGHRTHGGRIPLNGYAVQGKPVVTFDATAEKLVIDFETVRTAEPLRAVPQFTTKYRRVEPVPDISDGLTATDEEFAPGASDVAHHQFALLVSEYKLEGRDAQAFSSAGKKPVHTFTHGGKKHYVYLDVQVRSYENNAYEHEYRIPLEDIEEHEDGHEMWIAGHTPVFKGFEEIDPASISVRLSSNRKNIVVNAKLRRDGDFEFCKREFPSVSMRQTKRGSLEARDHGEEQPYCFDDWAGEAAYTEIVDIMFIFKKLNDDGSVPDEEKDEDDFSFDTDEVLVGTAGGYAVYAAYHVD